MISKTPNKGKQCFFCTNGVKEIDYKDIDTLKNYLDPYGRIANHKRSGVCSGHQRALASAIKRARFLALLPFIAR